ncbi:SusD/RagB family nutrient-binding outer membrane lipoprotein [Algoriphagus namhaensis]
MRILNKITAMALCATMVATSCSDEDLLDLNLDQNSVTEIDMSYLFSLATLNIGGEYENTRANMLYAATMIQHTASTAGYFSGDKYFYNAGYSGAYMERHFTSVIGPLSHVINETADDPNEANINAAATVMRVFDLHRMTDMHGDIPYTQAGQGLQGEENWFPAYQSQEEVYGLMIADLRAARDRFSDSARPLGNQDFLYFGDLSKWRKFSNALLMRIAMRMSNVDPATAQQVFTEANANSFTSNDDIAFIHYTDGPIGVNRNGLNDGYWNTYKYSRDCKISKTFMDWMINNDDPRLMILSGGTGNPEDPSTWDTDPANQMGMPNGYNSTNIREILDPSLLAEYNQIGNQVFSMLNLKYLDWQDPYFLISYAEVELMRAEAAVKGWISSDAAGHFANGVAAAINSWTEFDPSFARTATEIQGYISGRGFAAASDEDKLRLIGEEYWAATYLNDLESWANWRRTGYPVLTPTQDPNAFEGNFIPRRLRYWESEIGSNPENYQQAISRMGGDTFATKVWWDGGN